MFGAVAVMVEDAMAVAAYQDGSMLVRVDPTDDPRLLQRPDVSRAEMGTGRSMGEGWIRVDAKALGDDTALNDWLETATGYLAGETRPQSWSPSAVRAAVDVGARGRE